MIYIWPLRRIKILLSRNGNKRRDRSLHSLQDCLDKPQMKSNAWNVFFLVFFLGSVVYICCYETAVTPVTPYLEVFPGDEEIVTERMNFSDVFNYEKDPHKIKSVFAEAEKKVKKVSDEDLSRSGDDRKHLPTCITRLIQQNISITKNETTTLARELSTIIMGGYYAPRSCRSKHKVGIVVPYRNRGENLAVFLYNIHPFLIRQNLEYRIFVIEQYGKELFNRGRLFNAGFLELQKMGFWPCVIFHDVDLLPTDDRILYTCTSLPLHMCATVVDKEEIPKYRTLFGGVTAMTAGQFRKVNGYSNMYWGWGAEDNDMFWRLKESGMGLTRYKKSIARFVSLPHSITPVNENRHVMLKTGIERYKKQKQLDGLTSVQYSVVSYQIRHLYTHVLVDINPRKENISMLVIF